MTTPTEINWNWNKAAESARQIAKPFMDLQSLVVVLEDLAGKQNAVGELTRKFDSLKVDVEQWENHLKNARRAAEQETYAARNAVADAMANERAQLDTVHAELVDITAKRDAMAATVTELETRVATLRTSIADAQRAVA